MQWGAGSGKTFTGAQLVRQWCDSGVARTINVAGPTWGDTMRTMVYGTVEAPGLLGVWPQHQRPTLRASKDNPHLTTHNGAKINLFAAQKAERFRGAAADRAWFDEIDAWKPEGMSRSEAFALAEQRIRTGTDPRIICTSTPKRVGLIAELITRDDCVVTRATMYDNAVNLADTYLQSMHQRYDGTRLGRQELLGEILPDVEGAIVTMEMIKHDEMPTDIGRVVVGVDPFGGGGDACGISVAGKAGEHEAFVLADRTCKLGPDGWAKKAIETALEYEAECIVWEANYGGDMVPTVLTHAMDRLKVRIRTKKVWASKAKHIRFEPIGGMYERGEVTHVGSFPELEDEITQFTPQGYEGGESPNRADALVFALAELFPARKGPTLKEINDFMEASAVAV
jgi:phage terminase large subunit-like protein